MGASLLAALVAAILLAAVARRYDVSAPLALVVAGLAGSALPGFHDVHLDPDLVLFVILPPLLWSAGLESSYVALRRNIRPIGFLAVGLPLATTFVVGIVAFHTVPELTIAAALTLGAIVAPPDAVSATAVGRRLGLPRRTMTLLGGESLLNDATALTAYKVALGAAIGTAATWGNGLATFGLAAVGGVVVGWVIGMVVHVIRTRLDDPLVESAVGLVAPFFIYLLAEEIHGSGVIAVVVAALLLGQRETQASYATRLQDKAVWKALQLILESFAFLLIGLQLPKVISELAGISAATLAISSAAVLITVIGVRMVWVYATTYLPRLLSKRIRTHEPEPPRAQVFVVAWAGMRGVVSLAAAFGVPATTLAGDPFPGRPQLVFLTFVVVVGTLLLHGLTLPWFIRVLGAQGDEAHSDAIATAAAQDKAARAAAERLDELLAEQSATTDVPQRAADVLRAWNTRRRNAAWERLGRGDDDIGESPTSAFRRLRLEMLAAERDTFIAERDAGHIDDEVLRTVLHGLDLEEATLNRD
ncbi:MULTISPECIES: Na+/H+ antiporter [Mycolicibacterium]|uniref:Na+/H+ antiporter n=5 Tax=Mycolicibacterium TaxID=1866885 RepID=A0A378W5R1_9MYCO|nr:MULTISPECIES: Na+/H+ antiporter [Mycolicibacterium]KLI08407.1 sodium:proton exchanger [Mycolicibacterium senegalense]KLO52268.1 sodium:proton exchanger [Mycolicibacterium senegalense]KMV16232.1 sodium:proton exchanger [Mycolicibacterium conceptionense]MCV7334265.1 Na+/H+ antiporter [Mycolicibacterium senegalense]MCW1820075.1 Na+/H+ antiporter [Mycolicibacterium senegalense]